MTGEDMARWQSEIARKTADEQNKVAEIWEQTLAAHEKDIPGLKEAYDLAARAYRGKVRDSGDPYIIHTAEVAKTLIEAMDRGDLAYAALFHDILETKQGEPAPAMVTLSHLDIEKELGKYGEDTLTLVALVSKPAASDSDGWVADRTKQTEWFQGKNGQLAAVDIQDQYGKSYPENRREELLRDAWLIRIADRLHNLRTIAHLSNNTVENSTQRTARILYDTRIYIDKARELQYTQVADEMEQIVQEHMHRLGLGEL